MLPEALPDRETERLVAELSKLRAPVAGIFVNRVAFKQQGVAECRRCTRTRDWQADTLSKLTMHYSQAPLYIIRNFANEISGAQALRRFVGELWRLS